VDFGIKTYKNVLSFNNNVKKQKKTWRISKLWKSLDWSKENAVIGYGVTEWRTCCERINDHRLTERQQKNCPL